MAEFDLSAVLKDVSGPDTGRTQIEYIPADMIDPDPDNFYSLDGIEELAGNIEMLGLQQPLLVRPAKGGRYIVISGHRRRAAIALITDGGSNMFAAGVPCIVDRSAASDALRELKLIMANSDTRKMSSADQNRQALRTEDLLRQLEDEGFEFPGRLRDWVAKLSGMSRTKLARLKVIRDKLELSIRKAHYDGGKLSEEAAYELARLPIEHQRRVADWYVIRNKKPEYWYADTIRSYGADLARIGAYTCPEKLGGKECCNQEALQAKVWVQGYRGYIWCASGKRCCATCPDIATCRSVCPRMQEAAQAAKAQRREANRAAKEANAREDAPKAEKVRTLWLRFGSALSRANLEDADLRKAVDGIRMYQVNADDIARLEAGEQQKVKGTDVLPFGNFFYLPEAERLIGIADTLGCSLDYLFMRTDEPGLAVSGSDTPAGQEISVRHLGWLTGTPPDGQRAWAKFMGEDTREFTMLAHYREDSGWHAGDRVNPWSEIDEKCIGWWPLPEEDAPDLPGDLTPEPAAVPESDTMPKWGTGTPPKPGLYAVRLKVSETSPGEIHNFSRWTGYAWHGERSGKPITDMIVAAWHPLPEVCDE